MARSLFSLCFVLAAAAAIVLVGGTTPVSAQPVVASSAASTAPAAPQFPELPQAMQLLSQGKYQECIDKLKEASRRHPELPLEHVLLCLILSRSNQPNLARFELERAVHSAPNDPEPLVMLGNLALSERRIAEATTDYKQAQELLKNYTNASRKTGIEIQMLSGLAQVDEFWENWKDAESRLREILKLAPDDLGAHQRLAKCLFWQKNPGEAYKILKEAKKIDRKNAEKPGAQEQFPTPEAIMAVFYEQYEGPDAQVQKDGMTNAEIWFRGALAQAPNDLATRLEVAKWALGKKDKLNMVKEQAEAALKIEKEDSTKDKPKYAGSTVGRMLSGLVALWEKHWEEAERNFKAIIDESPNDFGAKNNLALALVEQANPVKKKQALDYAEANYVANNKNADALSTLGWVHFRRNEFKEAESIFNEVLKASNGQISNPDTMTYVAYILHQNQQDWNAKTLLEQAMNGNRPFSMRLEAEDLYKKVKDAKKPEAPKAS
jgi:tetratricopeptide (TPR) repeat protein